jgi:hypothetical protein
LRRHLRDRTGRHRILLLRSRPIAQRLRRPTMRCELTGRKPPSGVGGVSETKCDTTVVAQMATCHAGVIDSGNAREVGAAASEVGPRRCQAGSTFDHACCRQCRPIPGPCKSSGWCTKRSGFGPRTLGARVVVCDASHNVSDDGLETRSRWGVHHLLR